MSTPNIAAAIGLLLTGMQKNPFFAPPPLDVSAFSDRALRAHRQMDLAFDTYSTARRNPHRLTWQIPSLWALTIPA